MSPTVFDEHVPDRPGYSEDEVAVPPYPPDDASSEVGPPPRRTSSPGHEPEADNQDSAPPNWRALLGGGGSAGSDRLFNVVTGALPHACFVGVAAAIVEPIWDTGIIAARGQD